MRTSGTALLLTLLAFLHGCGDGEDTAAGPGDEAAGIGSFPAAVYDFPGATYLTLAEQGPYADFENTVMRLVEYLEEANIEPSGELVGVYFDDPWVVDPEKTRYEIRVPVEEGTEAEAPFAIRKTGTEQHAMVRLVGPYDKIRDHIYRLFEWVDENDYEASGPVWEVYLEHAGTGAKPAGYDTEIHLPVRKKDE